MTPIDEQDDGDEIDREIAAGIRAAEAEEVAARAAEVRDAFRAGKEKRDAFLGTFSDKIATQFWHQMRQCAGDAIVPPVCPPKDWHSVAAESVLAQARAVIQQAELSPFDEETLMGIMQVTLDSITGKEVNQADRKWLGLEIRGE